MPTKRYPFILAALCLAGCSDDSSVVTPPAETGLGEACTAESLCAEGGVCAHGICMPTDDPCVTITCDDGIVCRDGRCQTVDPCTGIDCDEGELCVEGQCRIPCGLTTCEPGQICRDNACHDTIMCGDTLCEPGNVCRDGACKPLCGDVVCGDHQTCIDGVCTDLCGGRVCGIGEACVNDICRQLEPCGETYCPFGDYCIDEKCWSAGDCNGIDCGEAYFCFAQVTCKPFEPCGDVLCAGDEICDPETTACVPGPVCIDGRNRCGSECCDDQSFCGDRDFCCDRANTCGANCCTDGETCENEVCHKTCDAGVSRCTLEDGSEICCAAGEICTSNQCFTPSVSCIDSYMCDNGQYCDKALQTCLPNPPGEVCKAEPHGGAVQPTLVWYWGETAPAVEPAHVQVMSAPMVADMNNDTIPEVVFNTFSGGSYQGNGILRILNGKTGELIASSDRNVLMTDGGSQVALGDLDGDTIPEIVTCSAEYKLAVFNFDPETNAISLRWKSTNPMRECGQGGPGIADFNGDGKPEVYVRYHVHDGNTGELLGSQSCVGFDNNTAHAPCDYSVAADLDGDGELELVGGNVAFKLDLENKQLVKVYDRSGDGHIDGYPAIADLDLDGNPEIAVVRANNNTLMAFRHDGSNFWDAPINHTQNGLNVGAGGPPTIANLDDTPNPEVTFAGRYAYLVVNYDGTVKWTRTTRDYSSAKTGSSVFDFDGDGKAEVVYADEYFLRVYDGESGETRFCQCNTSGTHWEYPVIADVNNDDAAEIIVSSNNSMIPNCPTSLTDAQGNDACVAALMEAGKTDPTVLAGTHGVRVFSSPDRDWVNTRKIYNQHAYSVTNISDNGSVPTHPKSNWTTQNLNNFRLNIQPDATFLPDLQIAELSSPYRCASEMPLYFRVVNTGWATALAGVTVEIWVSSSADGTFERVGSVQTTRDLRPTEGEALKFIYPRENDAPNTVFFRLAFGEGAPEECHLDNNSTEYTMTCAPLIN